MSAINSCASNISPKHLGYDARESSVGEVLQRNGEPNV